MPTPQSVPPATFPAVNGYSGAPGQTGQYPVPVPAPQPVVVPAQTTQQSPYAALPPYVPYGVPDEDKKHGDEAGSAYIPVDSWVYPELQRLYAFGFVDTLFQSMKPYTRKSIVHALDESDDDIRDSDNEQAKEILVALRRELADEYGGPAGERGIVYGTKSAYDRVMGINGQTLHDSFHAGQTVYNDYGRPDLPGFNNIAGFSTLAEAGRFSLFVRGEYQHAPAAIGYSQAVSTELAAQDGIAFVGPNAPEDTIPSNTAAQNPFRLVEATLSVHLLGHEISGGKSDAWLGPGQGGALAWSNNAEDIYSFRINRVEPLHIPYLSALLGPIRYDFFYGSLKGHTAPNDDWTHSEMFSFQPTANFQFAFQRTIIFGGHGHEPVTLHTFLKGFFDLNDTTGAVKGSRDDPGARFSDFSASYRLPFVRKSVLFYADSISHDDVTPISAPRRAAFRTGLFFSHIPGLPRLDFRVEAADTDQRVGPSTNGAFNYYEGIQVQGYTNKGFIMGDWIGREGKGGNAAFTYNLSGNEWVRFTYLNKKDAHDFIFGAFTPFAPTLPFPFGTFGPGGTTQNQFKIEVEKRFLHNNLELNAWYQHETWKAGLIATGAQNDNVTAVQITYLPLLKTHNAH